MLDAALIGLRWAQYATAAILFGSPLFVLFLLPRDTSGSGLQLRWLGRLLAFDALALLAASLLALVAQTSILAGSLAEGFKPDSLWAVVTTTAFGPSALVRAILSAAASAVLIGRRWSRAVCIATAILGGVTTASMAWMGHGASTEGAPGLLHLGSDMLHVLAAAVWIGALVMFFGVLRGAGREPASDAALHRALAGFAGVGSALVAVLVATGLVNSWFLVGPDHLSGLWTTGYGRLLTLKLLLFTAMLALAAANRFRLTPGLGAALQSPVGTAAALATLRRSVLIETLTGFAVLAAVAWLGTLEPPSAMS